MSRLSVAAAAVAVALCLLYSIGIHMPIYAGVLAMLVSTVLGAWAASSSALSLLPRFMLLLYTLPFAVLAGSLMLDDLNLLNALAVDLIFQRPVAANALSVGLVGLLGLLAGFGLSAAQRGSDVSHCRPESAAAILTVPLFACFAALAALLSLISSRSNRSASGVYFEDALEAAQAGGGATLYVVSYCLLIVLCVDLQADRWSLRRRLKGVLLVLVVGYMTVFHQLMQGDREILGLIVGLLALHITRPLATSAEMQAAAQRQMFRRSLPIAGLAMMIFLAVGQLRYSGGGSLIEGGIVGAVLRELASGGTWTAVFLGNLGQADEHQSGSLTYLYGKTYIDYLLSLPPGIVSNALGLVRPLEGASGPGLWYYPLQWGGAHPVLVPFKNFGIWGVLVILTFYGWLIGSVDRRGRRTGFWVRIVYGTFFAASFNWFWYGDMPFLRALMAAGIVGLAYRLILVVGNASKRDARPAGRPGQCAE
jgi:hypothetical protein